ncbi:MAG: GNAT family N-acetyltransferase [Mycobacteriales bacterium]
MTQLFMTHPGPIAATAEAGPGLRLRAADGRDGDALAALLTDAFEETWDVDRVDRDLLAPPDVVRTWVVEDDSADRLLATASERLLPERYPGAGYLHWVGTSPQARGHGFGALVVRACLAGFADRGLGRCVLETDDFRLPAVALYLKLGFIPEYRNHEEQVAWSMVLPQVVGVASGLGSK